MRLTQGDFGSRTDYAEDPVALAQRYEAAGVTRLHLVDLDGARCGAPRNLSVLERMAAATSLRIDFSGGLRTEHDLAAAFNAGAAFAALGSIAVHNRALFLEWLRRFGAERIILAADTRTGVVVVSGWTAPTPLAIADFIGDMAAQGVRQVLCTEVSRDGLLAGPAFDLYTDLTGRFPGLGVIASGGVGSIADVAKLDQIGVSGVVIGKALLEGRISIEELEPFLC